MANKRKRKNFSRRNGRHDLLAYMNGEGEEGEVNTNMEIYVSSRGVPARMTPLPQALVEEIELSVEAEFGGAPVRPQYTVMTGSGEPQSFPHSEKTLETDEDKAAWAAYKEAEMAYATRLASRLIQVVQLECIHQVEDEATWTKRHKFLGLTVPEDEFERHFYWIEKVFVGDEEDLVACMTIPMRLAGAPPKRLEVFERFFRTSLAKEAVERLKGQAQARPKEPVELQE